MDEPDTITLDSSFDDSSLKAKYILFGDSKPNVLIYPAKKGITDRTNELGGGACSSHAGERVMDPQGRVMDPQGQVISTDGNGDSVVGGINADSGARQVSQSEVNTRHEGTKFTANVLDRNFHNIPGRRELGQLVGPVTDSSLSPKPKECELHYFVEEPDSPKASNSISDGPSDGQCKPDEDPESVTRSKKQNLLIEWEGNAASNEGGDAQVAKSQGQGVNTSAVGAYRGGRGRRAGTGSRGRGRKKIGSPSRTHSHGLVEMMTLIYLALLLGLWWLTLNSHRPDGNSQLECLGDGAAPDIPDLTRVVYNPSSPSGVSHGD
ncbi:hypothetical protein RHMOL_Rhmol09G0049300 [Rhododendron molle]|uniref:Uncharacterized protein n=1 Tax=Rhododendron molle TaxID=49168 RepID=A0ACC0MAZ9_RHOML|nr:hypothetical protein RHMOL_Rhmol09G0049300 [Rhododendron molle]